MKVCANCKKEFKAWYIDENKRRWDLRRRKYCLDCNPFGKRLFWRGKNVVLNNFRNAKKTFICQTCGRSYTVKTRNLECISCRNKKSRKERKAKAYELLGNKCLVCGYNNCLEALDLHHVNEDDKKFTFDRSWGLSWEDIEKEIKKCVLLCCRCHRELHAGQIQIQTGLDNGGKQTIVIT